MCAFISVKLRFFLYFGQELQKKSAMDALIGEKAVILQANCFFS
jgi:hypothetical protein